MSKNNEFYQEYRTIDGQEYDISGYYEIGGLSYLSGRTVARGYYLSATKIKRERGFVTVTLDFGAGRTSVKDILEEVNRKSQKAENIARAKITEERIMELVNYLNKKSA